MPTEPVEYHQMLRGPRRRWWKPLLTLLMALGILLPLTLLAAVPVILVATAVAAATGIPSPLEWAGRRIFEFTVVGPVSYAYLLLSLIALIPVAVWSTWAVHQVRPRFVSSVVGGIRWRWAARCVLILTPLWVAYLGISMALDYSVAPPPPRWWLLLAISVVLMPFQAAGEEYLFRGWLMQNVGVWFASPRVGLVVACVVSAATFSLAHGSMNVWILADLSALAVTLCVVTWRTGGLEAAIAVHAVNNVGVSIVSLTTGSWSDSFINTNTTSTPQVFAVSLLVDLIALALILWQAKRVGLTWRYQPATPAALPARPEVAVALPPAPAS